jgi:hypothetical protein
MFLGGKLQCFGETNCVVCRPKSRGPFLPEDGGSRLVVNVGIRRSVILDDRHLDVADIRASKFHMNYLVNGLQACLPSADSMEYNMDAGNHTRKFRYDRHKAVVCANMNCGRRWGVCNEKLGHTVNCTIRYGTLRRSSKGERERERVQLQVDPQAFCAKLWNA